MFLPLKESGLQCWNEEHTWRSTLQLALYNQHFVMWMFQLEISHPLSITLKVGPLDITYRILLLKNLNYVSLLFCFDRLWLL